MNVGPDLGANVCEGYQQMTKFAAGRQRVKLGDQTEVLDVQ